MELSMRQTLPQEPSMAVIARPGLGQRSQPSFRPLLSVLLASAVIASGGYFGYQRLNPAPATVAPQTAPVTRGSISASVNATGSAAAVQTGVLGFGATG